MASKGQFTGMTGVYLVAAELSKRELIVSPTSRSAAGADLLVTDQECRFAWSVQVKTNGKKAGFWLLNAKAGLTVSKSHVYVFVNLNAEKPPEYRIVPSGFAANKMRRSDRSTGSTWYSFYREDCDPLHEGWSIFESPDEGGL